MQSAKTLFIQLESHTLGVKDWHFGCGGVTVEHITTYSVSVLQSLSEVHNYPSFFFFISLILT